MIFIMISCYDLQNRYVNLYKNLRNYIWDFETVKCIANLEIACYELFPDIRDVRSCLSKLKLRIQDIYKEDKELASSFDALQNIADSDDSTYCKLNQVTEVLQV